MTRNYLAQMSLVLLLRNPALMSDTLLSTIFNEMKQGTNIAGFDSLTFTALEPTLPLSLVAGVGEPSRGHRKGQCSSQIIRSMCMMLVS